MRRGAPRVTMPLDSPTFSGHAAEFSRRRPDSKGFADVVSATVIGPKHPRRPKVVAQARTNDTTPPTCPNSALPCTPPGWLSFASKRHCGDPQLGVIAARDVSPRLPAVSSAARAS